MTAQPTEPPGIAPGTDRTAALVAGCSGLAATAVYLAATATVAGAGFGLALRRARGGHRLLTVAAWLLAAGAACGIGQIAVAVAVAVAVVVGLALRALGDRRAARFSVRCAVIIVLSGLLAAASAGSEVMGAAERLPIGTFLVWLAGLSVAALRSRDRWRA